MSERESVGSKKVRESERLWGFQDFQWNNWKSFSNVGREILRMDLGSSRQGGGSLEYLMCDVIFGNKLRFFLLIN